MILYETIPASALTMWDKLTLDEMAATMQDMDAAGEPVTPENLHGRGHSMTDITLYGLRAASLARKRSVKVASL
ncbi:hypothetical protein [Pseudochrobactrum sp. MP213Fo]|uniref:hypothetical protein n=1 Tax=Pseudochrobactrum sp. MP213Fo TaxID=3022250 RepID=UPI003B9DEED4